MLWPLLNKLNEKLDRRLVNTFLELVMAIVTHRHRNHGLLLSELGSYLLGVERSCAGTKRISNLVHSERWGAKEIEDYFWQTGLCVWVSLAEDPGSGSDRQADPGAYALVDHSRQAKKPKRAEEAAVLSEIDQLWGKEFLHIWDRGFAGNPWLSQVFLQGARFVLRRPKNYQLLDEQGQLHKPGEISKGKRSWEYRLLWDARRRCQRQTSVIAFPVADPTHQQPLWSVVACRKGQSPWYLLTSEPAHSPALAWRIVLAYTHRWQVEMAIRFNQCELAFESPRLFPWQACQKLLWIAGLVYVFLFSLLLPDLAPLSAWLLHTFCHRTGKRSRDTPTPLYRLHFALSFLWLTIRLPSSLVYEIRGVSCHCVL